jgi:hypothetical protein
VKMQQAGKDLAYAVVICKVWRLAMALTLLVVPSCVYKWSINPISNPKPRLWSRIVVTVFLHFFLYFCLYSLLLFRIIPSVVSCLLKQLCSPLSLANF